MPMTIEALPHPPAVQSRSPVVARLRKLLDWLQRDRGIWTDLVYGAIPLVPVLILAAIPGNTVIKVMAEYVLLAVLAFVALFLHGAWRQLRTSYRKKAARR